MKSIHNTKHNYQNQKQTFRENNGSFKSEQLLNRLWFKLPNWQKKFNFNNAMETIKITFARTQVDFIKHYLFYNNRNRNVNGQEPETKI